MNRKLVGLAIIGAMLLIAPIGRAAEEKPDATVKMTGKALSAGVGYSWGSGTLTYQGKEYPFSISGLSAGNIGASSAELDRKSTRLNSSHRCIRSFPTRRSSDLDYRGYVVDSTDRARGRREARCHSKDDRKSTLSGCGIFMGQRYFDLSGEGVPIQHQRAFGGQHWR